MRPYSSISTNLYSTNSIKTLANTRMLIIQVALERFVDDIAIEAIEVDLICKLGSIFSPVTVSSMATDLVTCIAGESDENRAECEQLSRQLDVLVKGSDILSVLLASESLVRSASGLLILQQLLMF